MLIPKLTVLSENGSISEMMMLDTEFCSSKNFKDDHVYLDAMGFGMGLCCLQLTFQASSMIEARELYDQLAPLCPIMLGKYLI